MPTVTALLCGRVHQQNHTRTRPPQHCSRLDVQAPAGGPCSWGSHGCQRKGTLRVTGCLPGSRWDRRGLFLDLEQLAAAQTHCPSIAQLQHIPVKSTLEGQQLRLCDTSSCWRQPLVPLHWQKKVFLAVQSFAHPGIRASGQLLSSRIVWRGMATNIGSWCWECTACQRAKVTTQPTSPI